VPGVPPSGCAASASSDLSLASTPLEALFAFVATFGMDFYVGDSNTPVRFVVQESIPFQRAEGIDVEKTFLRGNWDERGKYAGQFLYMEREHSIEVALAFIIDLLKYSASLRARGYNPFR